ncbi:GyrI-like domain-containing protein [Bauldia sp.]|uniref:GyrI-like domain-containing protein n=1 Tax=Bauldia sp. TaxID=2575872 RepID=UPI003BA90042
MEFKHVETEEMPYLYVDGVSGRDPQAVSLAMGRAFRRLMDFFENRGIAPTGVPMSVYYNYDPNEMTFRAAIPVSATDATKADGDIKADITPATKALAFTHVGPYRDLGKCYESLMTYVEANKLEIAPPTWEAYVNDPADTPEDQLRTDIIASLK